MGLTPDALDEIVRKEIALRVALGDTFTTYDITKAMREYLRSEVIHQDVRTIVFNLFNNNDPLFINQDYLMSACSFENGGSVAVFHKDGHQPQDYIDGIERVKGKVDDDEDEGSEEEDEAFTQLREDYNGLVDAVENLLNAVESETIEKVMDRIRDLQVEVA